MTGFFRWGSQPKKKAVKKPVRKTIKKKDITRHWQCQACGNEAMTKNKVAPSCRCGSKYKMTPWYAVDNNKNEEVRW